MPTGSRCMRSPDDQQALEPMCLVAAQASDRACGRKIMDSVRSRQSRQSKMDLFVNEWRVVCVLMFLLLFR